MSAKAKNQKGMRNFLIWTLKVKKLLCSIVRSISFHTESKTFKDLYKVLPYHVLDKNDTTTDQTNCLHTERFPFKFFQQNVSVFLVGAFLVKSARLLRWLFFFRQTTISL